MRNPSQNPSCHPPTTNSVVKSSQMPVFSPVSLRQLLGSGLLVQSPTAPHWEPASSGNSLVTCCGGVMSESCNPIDCSLPGSSRGFTRQEYWSGLPFPSPGALPDSGIQPGSPALQADSLPRYSLLSYEGSSSHMLDLWNLRGYRVLCLNKHFWRFWPTALGQRSTNIHLPFLTVGAQHFHIKSILLRKQKQKQFPKIG